MRKPSLGRGLSQLIPSSAVAQSRAVIDISLDRLHPNPFQPRQAYDPETLSELVESIRSQGILQPILVRPAGEDYEIVLGERRWRAAEQAGLQTIPCMVQEVDDRHVLELALVENIQREDLNCMETARAYQQLVDEFGFTHDELSARIGKSRSAITNTMRLLQLPGDVQMSLLEGEISEGHGRALLTLVDDADKLLEVWATVRSGNLSVRETEKLVRKSGGVGKVAKRPVGPKSRALDSHLNAMVEHLQAALATEVNIRPKSEVTGTIVIHYTDAEELERIVQTIAPGEYW